MAQTLLRPVFEIKTWPASELEYWAAYFSIDDNKDKPNIPVTMSQEQQRENLIRMTSRG